MTDQNHVPARWADDFVTSLPEACALLDSAIFGAEMSLSERGLVEIATAIAMRSDYPDAHDGRSLLIDYFKHAASELASEYAHPERSDRCDRLTQNLPAKWRDHFFQLVRKKAAVRDAADSLTKYNAIYDLGARIDAMGRAIRNPSI